MLPGAGTSARSSRPQRSTADTIYNAVKAKLHEVCDFCLVLHSYAGVPGAEVINRLIKEKRLEARDGAARLVRVVFIAAYTFPAGFVMDAKLFIRPEDPFFVLIEFHQDNEMNNIAQPRQVFFNDIASDSEAQRWVDKLEPACYLGAGPVISSDDWRAAPINVITTKQDVAIPPERQEIVWQGFPLEWLDAGHTPYISQPEKVAEVIMNSLSTK